MWWEKFDFGVFLISKVPKTNLWSGRNWFPSWFWIFDRFLVFLKVKNWFKKVIRVIFKYFWLKISFSFKKLSHCDFSTRWLEFGYDEWHVFFCFFFNLVEGLIIKKKKKKACTIGLDWDFTLSLLERWKWFWIWLRLKVMGNETAVPGSSITPKIVPWQFL